MPDAAVPAELLGLIDRAEEAIETYTEDIGEQLSPRFEMADYREVAAALVGLGARRDIPGPRFVEWGSGFAVVAAIAGRLGFDATGIENDPILHGLATAFHAGEGLATRLVEDDFLRPGDPRWLTDRFDLVYAYPWPNEVATVKEYFGATARPGSRLLLFLTFGELELWERA